MPDTNKRKKLTIELPEQQMIMVVGFLNEMINTLASAVDDMGPAEALALNQLINIQGKVNSQMPKPKTKTDKG